MLEELAEFRSPPEPPFPASLPAFYPSKRTQSSLVKRTVRRGEASGARAKEPGQGAGSSSRRRARHRRRRRRRGARGHHAARGLSRGDAGEASCRGGSGAASRHCAWVVGEGKRGEVNWRRIRKGEIAAQAHRKKKVKVVSEEVARLRARKKSKAQAAAAPPTSFFFLLSLFPFPSCSLQQVWEERHARH